MTINDIIIQIRLDNIKALAEQLTMREVREIASRHDVRIRSRADLPNKLAKKWGLR